MDHILCDYEQHLSQGNMNRSHRTQYKNKLRSKFQNIQKLIAKIGSERSKMKNPDDDDPDRSQDVNK